MRESERPISMFINALLGFVIISAIGMPLLQSEYIYPSFQRLLIKNTENDAVLMGRHMTRDVLAEYTDEQINVSDNFKAKIKDTSKDFRLWKIKIFSNSGETIYSTEAEDIGKINSKPYFHNIVAKGRTHTKVVKKNTKSLEDQIVSRDVVETYIPILKQGKFIGAFELYYDITDRQASMDRLISDYSFLRFQPRRAKRRLVDPGSREAALLTRRA
ncbi:MAG: hypothetical protein GY814_00175 [Gammaproteobacteria bacterium]|nr:hypothetical protein [Gammaproteobacteria bacterium]